MKKPIKKKLIKIKKPAKSDDLIRIGTISDTLLKATVSVKNNQVCINIDGFLNEFDAMLWAKQQSLLWKRELTNDHKEQFNSSTVH